MGWVKVIPTWDEREAAGCWSLDGSSLWVLVYFLVMRHQVKGRKQSWPGAWLVSICHPPPFHPSIHLFLHHPAIHPSTHHLSAAAAAKSHQSCLTLCNPMDCSLTGSSVHGIFQARVLEWGAIAFSAPSIYLLTYTFIYPSTYSLSFHLSSTHLSVRLPTIQLTIHLSIHHLPFVHLGVNL